MAWQHKAVKDLHWAINSPSLAFQGTHWCDESTWFTQHLQALDQNPAPLLTHLASSTLKNQRIGFYFESLWHYYFLHNPAYQLLESNKQLCDDNGNTLGELDLIVEHRASNTLLHIELALKFYLHCYTQQASIFIGPNLRDQLTYKLHHTFTHQLQLPRKAEIKHALSPQYISSLNSLAIFKGRLFSPLQKTDFKRHQWISQTNLTQLQSLHTFVFQALPKPYWLAENHSALPTMSYFELCSHCNTQELASPEQFAVIDPLTQHECYRLFIVNDHWLQRAQASLK